VAIGSDHKDEDDGIGFEDAIAVAVAIAKSRRLKLAGIYSHSGNFSLGRPGKTSY
jgi:hypothetical protein